MIRAMLLALILISAWAPMPATADDAMDQALAAIPSDAIAFVCAPSLKNLDADFQQAVTELKLQEAVPLPSGSLVAGLRAQLPFLEQLDENGPVAVVVLNAASLMELTMKTAIMVTAKDPAAMVAAMGGEEQEGGMWTTNIDGQVGYAAIRGKHVFAGQVAEVVKAIKDGPAGIGDKLKPQDRAALAGLDVAIWVNAETFFALAKPMAEAMLYPMMMMQAQSTGNAMDLKMVEMNKKNLNDFMDGASSMVFGLGLDRAGLVMRGAMTCKPGSQLALQTKIVNTSESLLRGLPGEEYVMAFGTAISEAQAQASAKSLEPFFQLAAGQENVDAEKFAEFSALVRTCVEQLRGLRGSVVPLKAGPDGLIGLTLILEVADSKTWLDSVSRCVTLGTAMVESAKSEEHAEQIEAALAAFSHVVDAEEIDATKVQHLKIDLAKLGEGEEEKLEEAHKVLGKEGLLMRMAAIDANTVLIAFGGGSERFATLIGPAKTGASPLDSDPGIANVSKHMPKERNAVYYLAADSGLTLAQNVATALEEEMFPVKMPKIDAPMAAVAQGGDAWAQFDLFFPMQLLVAGKDAGMTMMGTGRPADAVDVPTPNSTGEPELAPIPTPVP